MKYQTIIFLIGLAASCIIYSSHECCSQARKNKQDIALITTLNNDTTFVINDAYHLFKHYIVFEQSNQDTKTESAQQLAVVMHKDPKYLKLLMHVHFNICHDCDCSTFDKYGTQFLLLCKAACEYNASHTNISKKITH